MIFGVFWPFLVIFGVFRRFGDFRVFGSFWAVFGVFDEFKFNPYKCLGQLKLVFFDNFHDFDDFLLLPHLSIIIHGFLNYT